MSHALPSSLQLNANCFLYTNHFWLIESIKHWFAVTYDSMGILIINRSMTVINGFLFRFISWQIAIYCWSFKLSMEFNWIEAILWRGFKILYFSSVLSFVRPYDRPTDHFLSHLTWRKKRKNYRIVTETTSINHDQYEQFSINWELTLYPEITATTITAITPRIHSNKNGIALSCPVGDG